jgi:hypothetical protein
MRIASSIGAVFTLVAMALNLASCSDGSVSGGNAAEEPIADAHLNISDRSRDQSAVINPSSLRTNAEILSLTSEAGRRRLQGPEKEALVRAAEGGLVSAYYILYLNESIHGDLKLSDKWLDEGSQKGEPNSLVIIAGNQVNEALKLPSGDKKNQLLSLARRNLLTAMRHKELITVASQQTVDEELSKIDSALSGQ